MARRVRTDDEAMMRRRIRADKRVREETQRKCEYSGAQENVHESYGEAAEHLGIVGDWDEIKVTDLVGYEVTLQEMIEEFYDRMIEKVMDYIGAE